MPPVESGCSAPVAAAMTTIAAAGTCPTAIASDTRPNAPTACSAAMTASGRRARSSHAPATGPVANPGNASAPALTRASAAPPPRASTSRTTPTAVISFAVRPIRAATNRRRDGREGPTESFGRTDSAVKHQEPDEPIGARQALEGQPRIAALELIEAVRPRRHGHGAGSDVLAAADVVRRVADHEHRLGGNGLARVLGGHPEGPPRDPRPVVAVDAEGAAGEVAGE